nr:reductive dehalogenase [uncultured bacterium]
MNKFHSTVSRRDFMKGIGLAGVGIGGAAAAAPVFHDLDEVAASASPTKRPWWVKEVDEPTIEVDWDKLKPFDYTGKIFQINPVEYVEPLYEKMKQAILTNKPGSTLRDHALFMGSAWGAFAWPMSAATVWATHSEEPGLLMNTQYPDGSIYNHGGAVHAFTPDSLGVPRWEGTPEENLHMLRAAISWFGGADVSAVEIDDKTRKLIFSHDTFGKPFVWEDVEKGYETSEKRVIPNKCKWMLNFNILQSAAMTRVGPNDPMEGDKKGAVCKLEESGMIMGYSHVDMIHRRTQEFMHTLGYQCMGSNEFMGETFGAIIGVSNLSGLGETGRHSLMISPIHGSTVRMPTVMLTDLPLAPGKPINAGIHSFCKSCGVCAEACPAGAIPSDKEPSWEPAGPWNQGGVKMWYNNRQKCQPIGWGYEMPGACNNCQGVCPFTSMGQAGIHDLTKGTIANTSMFNGFFYNMHKAFGFGITIHPDDWWNRDLSTWSHDTTLGR